MKTRNTTKSRHYMMQRLEKSYPGMFISMTEDFNGSEGGIWLSGEDGIEDRNGNQIFNYYAESENYTFGVINHLDRWAERNGWYFEWNDPGTIMMWEI
jgi:hypothetical protein